MKKLLVFSILFLTCSLGLKSVKADTSLDNYNFYNNSWLVSYNIFDTEVYNYGNYNGSNIHYKTYTEDYIDNYNSLVAFFKENNYYYIFGNDKVAFWQAEGLEPITYAYSDDEGAWLSSTLYNANKDIVYYAYYSSELNSSNILNKKYGSRDIFCADGNSIFRIKSGTNSSYASYTTRYSISDYSVVLDTNVGIRFDTDYFLSKKNYSSMTDDVRTYYHSITVNNKTYNSGDYIYRGGSKVENPKISLKYLTTTGDNTGSKIGATVSINFNIFHDSTRYQYLLSFDGGKTWDDKRLAMSSSTYTFTKLENFNVIAQLYDTETDKSYYSTLLVDKIDMSYHSRWLSFQRDDTEDEYTIFNGINYLTRTKINVIEKFNQANGYPLTLYYSRDGSKWERMSHSNAHFSVHSNGATYFLYRDQSNNTVFRSTYTASCFKETSLLGETINFDEEQPTDDSYVVYVTFVNYREDHFYWVKEQSQDYQQISMRVYSGMYKWTTQEKKTYCARITEDSEGTKVIKELCHTTTGIRIIEDMDTYVDSTIDFINEQRNKLEEISDLLKRMYEGLPTLIKNFLVFCYFLFCMSCIIWNIRK